MSAAVKPNLLMAALIAITGIVVAFAILRFVPMTFRSGVSGGVTGVFGILALQRVWPGIPFAKIHYIIGAMVVYGLIIGVVGSL